MVKIIVTVLLYTFIFSLSGYIKNKIQRIDEKCKNMEIQSSQKNYVIKLDKTFLILWTVAFIVSFLLVIVLLTLEHFLSPAESGSAKLGFSICVGLFTISSIGSWLGCVYGVVWEVRVEGEKIFHRTMFGKIREYAFSDITKVVSNHYDELRIYIGERRIFTLIIKLMDSYQFERKLSKLNIPVEDTKKMNIDSHIMQPLGILKWGAVVGLLLFIWLAVKVIIDKEGLLLAAIISVFAFILLCGVLTYFLDKTEVQGNTIIQHGFLKKVKIIKIDQITCVKEETTKTDMEYIVIYIGKEKVMRIPKGYSGVELFKEKMKREKKKWYEK